MYKRIAKYQFITTDHDKHSHEDLAEFACLGGVSWIQLRMKNADEESKIKTALGVREVCKKYGATFIVNDDVQLARQVDADGVHLGKEDMPIADARKLLGEEKIIGGTANAVEEVISLGNQGVDYVGLGPYRFTNTKKNLNTILGLKHMKLIAKESQRVLGWEIPIVAVGGIQKEDVRSLLEAGLYGCAVSSAVANSEYKIIASAKFAQQIRSVLAPIQ